MSDPVLSVLPGAGEPGPSGPWLTIVGVTEDGPAGLPDASRAVIAQAQVIFGGARHLALVEAGTRGRPWPVPFDIAPVLACRGQRVVVLASGDPFWFGAGSVLAGALAPGDWQALPAPGVPSLACAALGWRLEEVTCLGLHASPLSRLRPHLQRGCRIIVTLRDGAAPAQLAAWLDGAGFGALRMVVMERLGGPHQRLRTTRADAFDLDGIAAPVAVALDGADLARAIGLPHVPGLPEDAFAHDGQITKAPVRALTLAALAPRPGEHLWDIGGGSGSVSVEWCLAGGHAITIEPRADRIANITRNIEAFGLLGRMQAVTGSAPEVLDALGPPDAVFVGGGGSDALFAQLLALPPGTRIVSNAVTLESEARLMALHGAHGGSLLRADLAQAQPLGRLRGWSHARPILQWSVVL